MTFITYSTIRHDIFLGELIPLLSNNKVIFVPSGNKPSIEIFIGQMGRINQHLLKKNIPKACQAGLKTVSLMRALRFKKSAQSYFLKEVGTAVLKQNSFVDAVHAVASAMKLGSVVNQYLCSAASKILQGFPKYADSVFIYDEVVGRVLKVVPAANGSARLCDFNKKFTSALQTEKIDDGGTPSSFPTARDFINQESMLVDFFFKPHACGCLNSISTKVWENYVERRTLDRILWLKQAAIDLATKNGIPLGGIDYQIGVNSLTDKFGTPPDSVVDAVALMCENCRGILSE